MGVYIGGCVIMCKYGSICFINQIQIYIYSIYCVQSFTHAHKASIMHILQHACSKCSLCGYGHTLYLRVLQRYVFQHAHLHYMHQYFGRKASLAIEATHIHIIVIIGIVIIATLYIFISDLCFVLLAIVTVTACITNDATVAGAVTVITVMHIAIVDVGVIAGGTAREYMESVL